MRFSADADGSRSLRTAILESAVEVFISEGYLRATVAAIAEHAGVGADTVYATFGSKADLLAGLILDNLHQPVVDSESGIIANAVTAPEVIGVLADLSRHSVERGYAVYKLGNENRHADPRIDEAMDAAVAALRLKLTAGLDRLGALGLNSRIPSRGEAADVLYFYLAPPAWHVLIDSGWSLDRAREFLAGRACRALLPCGTYCR